MGKKTSCDPTDNSAMKINQSRGPRLESILLRPTASGAVRSHHSQQPTSGDGVGVAGGGDVHGCQPSTVEICPAGIVRLLQAVKIPS